MAKVESFLNSNRWEPSAGLPLLKEHHREKHGTGHAVCSPLSGACDVHYDQYNPHQDLISHLREDVPTKAIIGLGLVAVAGYLAVK